MTLKEIASIAGVATSTVSLVLNNKPGVHKDTRKRITDLLTDNGYTIRNTSSITAKNEIKFIRYKSSNHISERNEDYYSRVLLGVEHQARLEGYSVGIINVSETEFPGLLRELEEQPVAGILLLASEFPKSAAHLLEDYSLPLITLDKQLDEFNVNTLATSNIAGAYSAVCYLYQLGHRKIGFLKGEIEIGGLPERLVGYRRALKDCGLPYNEKYIVTVDVLIERARVQMKEHLNTVEDIPTAFFAANDIIGAGCMRALQEEGYQIPSDISIIGFDDNALCLYCNPNLSTIRIPCTEFGASAVKRLLEIINGDNFVKKGTIGTSLIKRESTAPPKSL